MTSLTANELRTFFENLSAYERELEIKNKQDQFLDLYNQWLETKNIAIKDKVNTLAEELKTLDNNFKFTLLP
ncbi:hypothetical protein KDK77_04405 [bacterium]|nr:hypothetical protein [bacterium]MCP5463209.1 hypothetical protein [bacterium]